MTGQESPIKQRGRLTAYQVESIRHAVREVTGDDAAQVWLFGSRADETLRGGDIDLFIETLQDIPNRAKAIYRIYAKIVMALGDREIDVLLKDAKTPEAAVFRIARQTGILL